MPDSSPNGLPAAIGFIASFIWYVILVLAIDYAIEKFFGVTYTITFGIRYLIQHLALMMLVLLGIFFILVVALLLHFLRDMPLLPVQPNETPTDSSGSLRPPGTGAGQGTGEDGGVEQGKRSPA